MAIFRQYIAPLLILIVFLVALVAVSSRIFLPSDMAAPAPVEEVGKNLSSSRFGGSEGGDAGAQALAPFVDFQFFAEC